MTAMCLAAALAAAESPAPASLPALGAKVWIGHYAEYEEFVKTAPIERVTNVPIGVTKPRQAFFTPGGLATSGIVKHLPTGQPAASGRPTSRRSPPTSSTACSASTWCR